MNHTDIILTANEFIGMAIIKFLAVGWLIERWRLKARLKWYKKYVAEKAVQVSSLNTQLAEIKKQLEEEE